jgi:uncharacterized protein YceK
MRDAFSPRAQAKGIDGGRISLSFFNRVYRFMNRRRAARDDRASATFNNDKNPHVMGFSYTLTGAGSPAPVRCDLKTPRLSPSLGQRSARAISPVAHEPNGTTETSMNLIGFKSWYQSLGVWGSLGTIIVGILTAIHVAHSAQLESDVNSWSAAAGVVISGLVSLYGRIRATKQISTPTTTPGSFTSPSVFAWFALATLLLMSGCASLQSLVTPSKVYPDTPQGINERAADELQAGYTEAVTATNFAYGAGAIDAQQYAQLQASEKTAKVFIDQAYNAAYSGQLDIKKLLDDAAKQLADYRAQRDAKKKN